MTAEYMLAVDAPEPGHRIVYWFGATERDRNELLEQLEKDALDAEHPLTVSNALNLAYLAAMYPLSDVQPNTDSQA